MNDKQLITQLKYALEIEENALQEMKSLNHKYKSDLNIAVTALQSISKMFINNGWEMRDAALNALISLDKLKVMK